MLLILLVAGLADNDAKSVNAWRCDRIFWKGVRSLGQSIDAKETGWIFSVQLATASLANIGIRWLTSFSGIYLLLVLWPNSALQQSASLENSGGSSRRQEAGRQAGSHPASCAARNSEMSFGSSRRGVSLSSSSAYI